MDFSKLDNQKFSERTLKGFLLKNVDPKSDDPKIQQLNHFLVDRVDKFWDQVVVPLQSNGVFDGNKINWYFQVYKEGMDAHKMAQNPFPFANIDQNVVEELVNQFKDKEMTEYLERGTSYLSNTYTLLSSWLRDQLVHRRLQHIYSSENPIDWIVRAVEEEEGVMKDNSTSVEGLLDVLNNIGLVLGRRV